MADETSRINRVAQSDVTETYHYDDITHVFADGLRTISATDQVVKLVFIHDVPIAQGRTDRRPNLVLTLPKSAFDDMMTIFQQVTTS